MCVVFAADVAVPQLFTPEELDDLGRDKPMSCLTSRAFTTEYASAIVNGRLHRVQEAELWREALRAICRKYTPHDEDLIWRVTAENRPPASMRSPSMS